MDLVVPPPEITPRGGTEFTLELRYPVTAYFYGYGWISGTGVTNLGMFHLCWEGEHHKHEGDIATIKIAKLTGSYTKELTVWGKTDRGGLKVVHKDKLWQGKIYEISSEDWLRLRIEIHGRGVKGEWAHEYDFRLRKELFEVDEIA